MNNLSCLISNRGSTTNNSRMPQMVEDQTPATRNRNCHRDDALLWRMDDSEEENKEEEQESSSRPADVTQACGPSERDHLAAPDGGWGWAVLVVTMLVLSLTLAFPSCIGIFYTDLQTEFNASNTETAWVPAIMTAMLHAGGRGHISRSHNCNTLFSLYDLIESSPDLIGYGSNESEVVMSSGSDFRSPLFLCRRVYLSFVCPASLYQTLNISSGQCVDNRFIVEKVLNQTI